MNELFSAFGIKGHLLIAQAVNFGIVLVALRYFLYTPVMAAIAKRQELVAKSVTEARQVEELFARADGEAEAVVKAADVAADKIVEAAHESAGAEKTRIVRDAEERASAVVRDATLRAAETLEKARRESEREVARLAVLAAEKVLRKND